MKHLSSEILLSNNDEAPCLKVGVTKSESGELLFFMETSLETVTVEVTKEELITISNMVSFITEEVGYGQ